MNYSIIKKLCLVLSIVTLVSCNNSSKSDQEFLSTSTFSLIKSKNKDLTEEEQNTWLFKDVIMDTIPGTSLNKAYSWLEDKEIKDTIIVAVIDSSIDIEHEDFNNQIWVNTDEIEGNKLDDDGNGYVDDINGWNFLGNAKGEQNRFTLYESTRILKKYNDLFHNNSTKQTGSKDTSVFKLYTKAKLKYEEQRKEAIADTAYANMLISVTQNARRIIIEKFPETSLSRSSLDSLRNVYANTKNKALLGEITKLGNFLKYGFTPSFLDDYKLKANATLSKLLNLDYNDRIIQGDNEQDISDKIYGNNNVRENIDFSSHGTIVSGVIGAVRDNGIGIDGIAKAVKIMPVIISGYGEENDKDIALGIRYAVNNGARVINMSFGKDLSLNKIWVDKALKYAEEHGVLIISSGGNKRKKLNGTNEFPTDSNGDVTEVSSNFIHIGASTHIIENKLVASFSNYSNVELDLFAPGSRIKTLLPNNKYKVDSGTSIGSAVVSGIAALVWSYYPDISAVEMKEILMITGNSYNINTEIKSEDGTTKLVPFSELSKSGKVVNAYNALLLAEKIAKE